MAAVPTIGPGEVKLVPTTIRVSRSVKFKPSSSAPGEEAHSSDPDEIIEIHQFATQPGSVYLGVDFKKAKDYNSAGCMIGVTIPCYSEEIERAMQRAYHLVMERLKVELPKIIKAAYDLRDMRIAEREKAA